MYVYQGWYNLRSPTLNGAGFHCRRSGLCGPLNIPASAPVSAPDPMLSQPLLQFPLRTLRGMIICWFGRRVRLRSCFRLLDWSLPRLRLGGGLLLGVSIGALVRSRRLWGNHRGNEVFSWLWSGRDCDES